CSKFIDKRADICNSIKPTCPLRIGENYTYSLTDRTVNVKYKGNMHFQLIDLMDVPFLCLDIAVDVE
ncbi:hypothetical protein P879_12016, partial [Paragonimus westermani]